MDELPIPADAISAELEDLVFAGLPATRRSFLRAAGFGVGVAAVAGCSRAPVQKAIPHLTPPESIVPGRAYAIASTCAGCSAACGVLATCRDGRPVKLEGNPEHPLSRGGLCAVGQAELLSLYDSQRLDGARDREGGIGWDQADQLVVAELARIRADGGRVRLLTGTVHSPSTRAVIGRLLASLPDAAHVQYDAASTSAILDAHARSHGQRILPRYFFEQAQVVASFDADFLGTWISPVEHAAGWRQARDPEAEPPRMSTVVQFEGRLSLTGTRADRRVRIAPWETEPALARLVERLGVLAGGRAPSASAGRAETATLEEVDAVAGLLWQHRGAALVVAGAADGVAQDLVNRANVLLGAYGRTLDVERPSLQKRGDERALEQLRQELAAGAVDLLLVAGCNPVYELPDSEDLLAGLSATAMVIACSPSLDETAAAAHLVLPEPHSLESWGDAEPVAGFCTLQQPTAPPLRSARTLRATLARWMGDARGDRELLQAHWESELFARQDAIGSPAAFFAAALSRGFAELAPQPVPGAEAAAPAPAGSAFVAPADLVLVLHPQIAIPDGRHAHNPWLQELPDPVSKVAWDNCASVSPATARELGLRAGDVVRLNAGERAIELPAWVQTGQHDRVVAVALGYGRAGTDRFADVGPEWLQARATVESGGTIGENAAPLVARTAAGRVFAGAAVTVEKTGRRVELACSQDHHTLEVPAHLAPKGGEVRDPARELAFAAWQADPEHALHRGHHAPGEGELWAADHENDGPRWGLAVDLAACTGCSACVIACQAENNVPVVGKDEVRRHREMHWLRIDRYFEGAEGEERVHHQPMMCQHCDHAPCETVCPVLATVHSASGLNQQVYNRCVGTRYCANNCPYKVRRFNWFDYAHDDALENLALNPDVTVRSRGVMEKCSMCVQRIQEARSEARRRGEKVEDGAIRTACQQSCPTQAIVFGDHADPAGRMARLAASHRAYGVLDELGVAPSVRYLAGMNNDPLAPARAGHAETGGGHG
ncbi:MAG TPA: 4Fe-4S dicluster domain-containing protein [Planctomycetota bacterium]